MAKIELSFLDKSRQQKEGWSEPSVSNPFAWTMGDYWGEGLAKGRKPTEPRDAIQNFTEWIYICASTNANSVASVPLRLYAQKSSKSQKFKTIQTRPISKKTKLRLFDHPQIGQYLTKAEDVEEVTEHPFLELIKQPNPFMPAFVIKESTVLFLDLAGNAYWYLVRDRLGVPKQLWMLPPHNITPIFGETTEKYITGFKFERGNKSVELPFEDVVHFSTANPQDQYLGFGVVKGLANSIYTYWKMDEFEHALFENRARVGGVLEMSEMVSRPEMERLRTDWQQKYSGAAQAGKTMILPPGMKFTKDSMTPQEINFVEGRKITRETICAGFDQPIGLYAVDAIRANAESAQFVHAKMGIEPRCRRIEQVINQFMLPKYGNKEGAIFAAYDSAVPEDKVYALDARDKYTKDGIITLNEAREEIGKDPIDGGDEPLVDSRLVPLSRLIAMANEPKPEPVPPGKPPVPPDEDKPEDEDEDADKMATTLFARTMAKLREKLGNGHT